MGIPTVAVEADCSLDEFETDDIVRYLKGLGYVFVGEATEESEPDVLDLIRLIEEKIPESITLQTCIDDEYNVVVGKKKYEGKGCATIIVLPGR